MVCTVHMNTFGRMDLEHMDPQFQTIIKCDVCLKSDYVQNYGNTCFIQGKKHCGVAQRQQTAFKYILDKCRVILRQYQYKKHNQCQTELGNEGNRARLDQLGRLLWLGQ